MSAFRGLDVFKEIALTKISEMSMFFDVGANIGQTVRATSAVFPAATIHAFEPVKSTFETLERNTGPFKNVHCHNAALTSDGVKSLRMEAVPGSVFNSVVGGADGEEVNAIAGSEFCRDNGISRIDFLKIDTEGHDLEALQGFRTMLESGDIRFIQVEAGMNSRNTKHVFFRRFLEFFDSVGGYEIFGIYEQVRELENGTPLRRGDMVFVRWP